MVRRKASGYSMLEVVFVIAIFGILLLVLVGLQREFVRFDRSMRVDLFSHPAPMSVVARLRRDVLDSLSYPESHAGYVQSPKTLLLRNYDDEGAVQVVVYDFREPGRAVRQTFRGEQRTSSWRGENLPELEISSFDVPDGKTAVRLRAIDEKGRLAIDQIFVPRAN